MTNHFSRHPVQLAWLLALLCFGLFGLSLALGEVWLNPLGLLMPAGSDTQTVDAVILREIRLPRAVLAAAIGAVLGLAGAVLQGLLRNPLAEPGLIGVSATASLGAVIAIYSGASALFGLALPLSALTGALAAVVLLQVLAGRSGDRLVLILAGVAISSLAGALTSLVLNLSDNPFAAMEIVFWLMGSLTDRSLVHVGLALPFIVVGVALLLSCQRGLEALSLGDDVAASLGISLGGLRRRAILGTAIGVGAATAVSGAIGFVGLIVPHLLRPLVDHRPGGLLWASALGGAAFLLAADCVARVILPDRDLKLGVITATLGAPFFLWLLVRLRKDTE
ncbi:iron chelate uptake ABC transporter family permease subunit [Microvirga tunisiensis]|uniref:Iron chelate uptake ABC transporter family permease subunit n=1 Tax=Pannonibacter tanglangensis TaxID=2750084 RepID=A0A7X5EZF6_9HYPH|nr:iron ABC transporter permease [Pannonibacter sp. XCT-53]NBN76744.1 iron chelate uptake ABC transporter family permease subunit [Pannonibacter sp. XCT-53]